MEFAGQLHIGLQLPQDLVEAGCHVRWIFQRRFGLGLERPKVALPVQAKAQCRIERGENYERKPRSVLGNGSPVVVGPIGVEVMVGRRRSTKALSECKRQRIREELAVLELSVPDW